jgi:hypothetical protein
MSTGKQRFGEVFFRQLQGSLEDLAFINTPVRTSNQNSITELRFGNRKFVTVCT